ncbi:MAG TPA: secondary thiamine-phosphate synthase enzyme YjbQ [Vulgatibacter sp.]|nr:secondary thiamine-phosphate synthase enzyme YjbQ [Vulgatibacter sp.]
MARAAHVFELHTKGKEEFVDLTARIRALVDHSGVRDGTVVVYCPHSTAGLTIQENTDPALKRDILAALESMVPAARPWGHSEGNAPAHVKAALLGTSCTLVVDGGRLLLGRWQGIYFVEFDGPRDRMVQVKILPA